MRLVRFLEGFPVLWFPNVRKKFMAVLPTHRVVLASESSSLCTLFPHKLKSLLWEDIYVGLICLLHLFHHWPQQQAEMFFTRWSQSCCVHGFPQLWDALSVSKWGHHPLLLWSEEESLEQLSSPAQVLQCLHKLWGAGESVLYSASISSPQDLVPLPDLL